MPRGKRKLSLDEQLSKTIEDIENTEDTLRNLKQTKKELEEQIKFNRLAELDEIISASGKTFDEVRALLVC